MAPEQVLYLCMGSACHQAGAMALRQEIEGAIERHGLVGRVVLKGAFCLETCLAGLSVQFEERIVTGVTSENLDSLFASEIMPRVRPS